ncbi:MAG: hypothetical protein IJS29_00790 [Selenomonadaceae bacterium]|nr:hypothetical protein [Selenomonadaceae bacterium]
MRIRVEGGVIQEEDIAEVKIGQRGKTSPAYEIWATMKDGSKVKLDTEYSARNAAIRANLYKPNSFILEDEDE